MRDPRDHQFLPWMLRLSVWTPGLLWLCWQRYKEHGFELWVMVLYHILRLGPGYRFFAYFNVLIHKEGHAKRGLFKENYRFLNNFTQLWPAPFYGAVYRHYNLAHLLIHHRWHNDVGDVHTNI